MAHKKRTQTPEYQWEQALLDAYHPKSHADNSAPGRRKHNMRD